MPLSKPWRLVHWEQCFGGTCFCLIKVQVMGFFVTVVNVSVVSHLYHLYHLYQWKLLGRYPLLSTWCVIHFSMHIVRISGGFELMFFTADAITVTTALATAFCVVMHWCLRVDNQHWLLVSGVSLMKFDSLCDWLWISWIFISRSIVKNLLQLFMPIKNVTVDLKFQKHLTK